MRGAPGRAPEGEARRPPVHARGLRARGGRGARPVRRATPSASAWRWRHERNDSLGLAFVGCGAIAEWHLHAIKAAVPRIDVTAVIDPDLDRAQAMAAKVGDGARPFGSLADAVAAGGFSAVDVMVPHHLHEPVALEAFDAGLHVLLEKPMAPTLDACDRILAAAARARAPRSWSRRTRSTGPRSCSRSSSWTRARSGRSSPRGRAASSRRSTSSTAARSRGASTRSRPAVASRSTPARTGSGRCACGSARSGRSSPRSTTPIPGMEGESLCRALCRFDGGTIAVFDALLAPGPLGPEPLFRITGTKGELTIEGIGRVKLYDGSEPRGHRRRAGQLPAVLRGRAGRLRRGGPRRRRARRRAGAVARRAARRAGDVPLGGDQPLGNSVGGRMSGRDLRLLGRGGARHRRDQPASVTRSRARIATPARPSRSPAPRRRGDDYDTDLDGFALPAVPARRRPTRSRPLAAVASTGSTCS